MDKQNLTLVKEWNPFFKGFSHTSPNRHISKLMSVPNNQNSFDEENLTEFSTLAEAAAKLKVSDVSSPSQISATDMNRILSEIKRDRKCEKEEAFAGIALLAQMGGTSARANDGLQVTVSTTTFNIELIRKTIKKITGKNLRRLAKSFAKDFYTVAKNHEVIGNLHNKITLYYPEFEYKDISHSYWTSDFQSENEKCPLYIREYLTKYYNDYVQPNNKNTTKKK